jgi:hypothetical protein
VTVLVNITDHAVERFRQRVGGRLGELDPRSEIAGRVARAWEAGRVATTPPGGPAVSGASGRTRGTVYVADLVDRALVFVCRHDRASSELLVITLWEHEAGPAPPRVPRRYTDALRRRRP